LEDVVCGVGDGWDGAGGYGKAGFEIFAGCYPEGVEVFAVGVGVRGVEEYEESVVECDGAEVEGVYGWRGVSLDGGLLCWEREGDWE